MIPQAMRFIEEKASGVVVCGLCPRRCSVQNGFFGACKVRGNKNGKGILPFYGYVTALAVDPIEKKPLFHFRPGSTILSAGFAGCNLYCPFCQNWHISQSTDIPGRYMQPGDLVSAALREDSRAIAYTYSEPLVHAEYLLDCMALARRHGIANVLVTNGCVNAEAAGEILSLTDAANIDLKCFSREAYQKTLGGDLDAVLAFIRHACAKGVHTEVTTLVVPGLNDSDEELDSCADFIASISSADEVQNRQGTSNSARQGVDELMQHVPAQIKSAAYNESRPPLGGSYAPRTARFCPPWHLSAYHPDYRWNAPPADPRFLRRVKEKAGGKLPYVYAGNIPVEENNTFCRHCQAVLVRRRGYRVDLPGLANPSEGEKYYRCAQCGTLTAISS